MKLIDKIEKVSHLYGEFVLRSGITSNEYFDKYRFESDPEILDEISKRMVSLIPPGTEVLAGLEMGGIPIVTMLSHHSGIPATFVRKRAKEYGTCNISEGADVKNKKILIIEDVVTSGKQIILSYHDLIGMGADITHALCVIDREQGGSESLKENGISLISLFTKSDFK